MSSESTLKFADIVNINKALLLEVDDDIIDAVLSGDDVVLRGQKGTWATVCTANTTRQLRQVLNSNTCCIASPEDSSVEQSSVPASSPPVQSSFPQHIVPLHLGASHTINHLVGFNYDLLASVTVAPPHLRYSLTNLFPFTTQFSSSHRKLLYTIYKQHRSLYFNLLRPTQQAAQHISSFLNPNSNEFLIDCAANTSSSATTDPLDNSSASLPSTGRVVSSNPRNTNIPSFQLRVAQNASTLSISADFPPITTTSTVSDSFSIEDSLHDTFEDDQTTSVAVTNTKSPRSNIPDPIATSTFNWHTTTSVPALYGFTIPQLLNSIQSSRLQLSHFLPCQPLLLLESRLSLLSVDVIRDVLLALIDTIALWRICHKVPMITPAAMNPIGPDTMPNTCSPVMPIHRDAILHELEIDQVACPAVSLAVLQYFIDYDLTYEIYTQNSSLHSGNQSSEHNGNNNTSQQNPFSHTMLYSPTTTNPSTLANSSSKNSLYQKNTTEIPPTSFYRSISPEIIPQDHISSAQHYLLFYQQHVLPDLSPTNEIPHMFDQFYSNFSAYQFHLADLFLWKSDTDLMQGKISAMHTTPIPSPVTASSSSPSPTSLQTETSHLSLSSPSSSLAALIPPIFCLSMSKIISFFAQYEIISYFQKNATSLSKPATSGIIRNVPHMPLSLLLTTLLDIIPSPILPSLWGLLADLATNVIVDDPVYTPKRGLHPMFDTTTPTTTPQTPINTPLYPQGFNVTEYSAHAQIYLVNCTIHDPRYVLADQLKPFATLKTPADVFEQLFALKPQWTVDQFKPFLVPFTFVWSLDAKKIQRNSSEIQLHSEHVQNSCHEPPVFQQGIDTGYILPTSSFLHISPTPISLNQLLLKFARVATFSIKSTSGQIRQKNVVHVVR